MSIQSDISSVLLLGATEESVVLEKRALRDMGISRISFMASGTNAACLLAGSPRQSLPDVIVCTAKLSDMEGDSFCALLRLHPLLKTLPTLIVLSNDSEVEHCKILGFNSHALLGRPYSTENMKNVLLSLAATRSETDSFDKNDVREFEKALAADAPPRQTRRPDDYYRVGRQALREERWNDAIEAFQTAMRDASLKGKAELGLAAAWEKKGDTFQCGRALSNAADEFVRAEQWENARAVYARLQRETASAKNPFLTRAQHAMRQGRHADAARYLTEGLALTPENLIRHKIAQICLSARDPEDMLQNLENSLISLLQERGRQLAASIRGEFHKLHQKRENWRREAEKERRHKVSLLLDRERGSGPALEGYPPTGQKSDTVPEAAESAENWRAVTKPLNRVDIPDESIEEFTGGNDFISVIKYTWKLARGQL